MLRSIKLAKRHEPARCDAWIISLFAGDDAPTDMLRDLDDLAGQAVSQLIKRPEFKRQLGDTALLYPTQGVDRLIAVGLGDPAKLDRAALLRAAAAAFNKACDAQAQNLALPVDHILHDAVDACTLDEDDIAQTIGEAFALANHRFRDYAGAAANGQTQSAAPKSPTKTTRADQTPTLTVHIRPELRKAFERGLAIGASANIARQLAATPPNVANPNFLVDYCKKMARTLGLHCRIIDEKQARKLNMGGLLAVGAGSDSDSALIILEWHGKPLSGTNRKSKGKNTAARKPAKLKNPIALVGKAVTFDTGGYSIKPREGMRGMKYDKCGGMAVIGALHAAATLKLSQPVVGVIPTVENMVDEDAFRVDDILTMHNGVTVEVTNTDAEGRLILADALAWTANQYKPRAVIDMATLTGGVVTALGSNCAGVFCNDDELCDALADAGQRCGERIWRLPLWDEHRQQMRSDHADLVNSAGRKAHPIQGAAFLSFFVGETAPMQMPTLPWAHLDIAGVADVDKPTPPYEIGPTGYGVRLMIEWLASL